jgi:hypothetical protein
MSIFATPWPYLLETPHAKPAQRNDEPRGVRPFVSSGQAQPKAQRNDQADKQKNSAPIK